MEMVYLSLHCHHQNDSCIKTGRDESQFNESLIVRDKVTRQCPQTSTFEEKGEPKRIRIEVPLLTSLTPYQIGSQDHLIWLCDLNKIVLRKQHRMENTGGGDVLHMLNHSRHHLTPSK